MNSYDFEYSERYSTNRTNSHSQETAWLLCVLKQAYNVVRFPCSQHDMMHDCKKLRYVSYSDKSGCSSTTASLKLLHRFADVPVALLSLRFLRCRCNRVNASVIADPPLPMPKRVQPRHTTKQMGHLKVPAFYP